MNKVKEFFIKIKPSKRKIIQLYAALLVNCNIKGYVTGNIYQGKTKSICVPGMNCYSCPGAVGACPIGSLQNALSESNTRTSTYVLGIILLYAILFGRTICGWLCPAGFIQELLYKIKTPKIRKSKFTRLLSYLKYFILGILVIGVPIAFSLAKDGAIAIPGFCKYVCPVGTFEGALGLLIHPNNKSLFDMLGGLFTWKFIVLILFILMSIFMYRFFCRFFCPLGAIYGLFNKIAVLGITIEEDKCTHCGICVSKCKMDVKEVGDHECINCGECKNVCPTHAITNRQIELIEYFKAKKENKGEQNE